MANKTCYIRRNKLHVIWGQKGRQFSFKFVKAGGQVIHIIDAVLLNEHYPGRVIRVKLTNSEEIRNIRTATIIEFNGTEVIQ